MSVGLGTAIGYLKLDISGFAKGVDSAISDMGRLSDNFSTTSQGLQSIGDIFTKAGTALTAGFTAPLAGFVAASVKAGTKFDSSMSQVEAVSKATGEDFQLIRDRAIEMGEETRYSAEEVSNAMYYMGLAGWDAQQIYKGIPAVLALGAASGEDLSRVSDIVTDSLTAFGKSADDTSQFVNVLAEASRSSNTTVDMMGESFKYVAPVAGAFGYSIEDVAIMLGIFANNGVKSSQAGTGLRQALNALINPSDKAAAVMDEYGVSLFNADGSTKDLMTVMKELRGTFGYTQVDVEEMSKRVEELGTNITDDASETAVAQQVLAEFGTNLPANDMEKLTSIVKIFGVRALPGMLSVINASEDDFESLSNAIYGAQDAYDGLGTAFGMQETMLDNLQGDWYLFTSALGTTKIILSDMVKGALRDLVQGLTDLVNKFNELEPEQQENILKWAAIVASIGPVLIIIGKLISGIGSMISTFNTLKAAFTFISTGIKHFGEAFQLARAGLTSFASQTNVVGAALGSISAPMVAIVALIAVLAAAFVDLWNNNEEFRNKIIEIWENIKAKFEEAGQRIVEIFNSLGFNFEDFKELMGAAIEWLKGVWDGFCELLAPVFVGAFEIIGNAIGTIVDLFVGVIEIITGIVKGFKDGDWSMLWQGIYDVVATVIGYITGILDTLGETIWNVIQTIAGWFGADWNMTWDEAKQAVSDWFNSVVQWVSDLVGKIGNFFSNIWQTITNICNSIWDTIVTIWNSILDTISNVLDAISTVVSNVWDGIKTIITTVLNGIKTVITNVWNAIKTFITTISDGIKTIITSYWNAVKTVITTIVNAIKTTITNVFNAIKSTLSTIVNGIKDIITNVWNGIKNTTSNIVGGIKTGVVDTFNNIKTNVSNIANGIFSAVSDKFNSLKDAMSNAMNTAKTNVVNAAKNVFNGITGVFKNVGSTFGDIGKNIIGGITSGITSMASSLFEGLKNTVSGAIDKVKSFFGIHSPSTYMRDQFGVWLPPGIAEGFEDAMPAATEDMEDSLNDGLDSIKTKDIDMIDNVNLDAQIADFVNTYKQAFEGLVVWFETMEGRMAISVENLAEYFRYLMNVRQLLGKDDEFKDFVLSSKNDGTKPKNPKNPIGVDTPGVTGGGDTFIFNSPKAIDEIQAARLLRNTKRDLAEGF